jgi:hypothetical protein
MLKGFNNTMADSLEGTFKCYNHNFSANDPEAWQKHIANNEHEYTGSSACVTCGTDVVLNWKGKLKNRLTPNVLCKECKAQ